MAIYFFNQMIKVIVIINVKYYYLFLNFNFIQ